MKTPLAEVVQPRQEVGGYQIDRKLGAGGFGQVYLARRDGVAYALKFLHLERVGDWGWRELLILMSHDLPHVVRLRSHFKWPEDTPDYLVLVMEYVPGVTLFQWARGRNPCAREVVEMLLPLAQALSGVHAAGVMHRDLKGDNVLVREGNDQPVLVDFGAGALPNAPPITRRGIAPGNLRYRTPESIRFSLKPVRSPGERYDYGVTDEMYALGVILYVLTTDVYPFDGPDEELMAEIVAGEPEPPCEVDSRVPVPLSDLCLRLLAQKPSDRVASAEALCGLLEALLEQAQGEPSWEIPLCYDWTEEGRTTEHAPELGGDSTQARLRRYAHQKPKRGLPPHRAALPASSTAQHIPVVPPWQGWRALGLGLVVGLVVMGVVLSPLLGQRPSPTRARDLSASTIPDEGPTAWATRALGAEAVTVPTKPFKGQATPPCAAWEEAINGGCWTELAHGKGSDGECLPGLYSRAGRCYLPAKKPEPMPSSARP